MLRHSLSRFFPCLTNLVGWKKHVGVVAFALFFTISTLSYGLAATINVNLPGSNTASQGDPAGIVTDLYKFALMIGALLAFAVIVYGGIRYAASAGNPAGQGEGKEWVKQAIYGLLLLLGGYFILYIINPNLTTLRLPTLERLNPTFKTPLAAAILSTTSTAATSSIEVEINGERCPNDLVCPTPKRCQFLRNAGWSCVDILTESVPGTCTCNGQFTGFLVTERACGVAVSQGLNCSYTGGGCQCLGIVPSINTEPQCNPQGIIDAYGLPSSVPGVSYNARCQWNN